MLPASLLVERKTRRLDQAEFLAIIHQAISQKYDRPVEGVRFHPEGFVEPIVPAGPLAFHVAGALALNQNRTTRLRWTEPGGRTGGANIRGRVEVSGEYLRAKRDIEAGEELHSSDFEAAKGPLPGLAKTYLTDTAELAGMASRRQIAQGDSIVREDLVPATVIHRGDLVELRLRSGSVLLRTAARAEQDGSIGGSVRCKNLQSNRLIEATVLSARVVEVNER
jgi:flagella basal body P-ring formation protein FlgA